VLIKLASRLVLLAILVSACVADDPVRPEAAVLRLQLDACKQGIGSRATAAPVGNGLAVTVAHAFDNIRGFDVVAADGTSTPGSVVFRDSERDVAVIAFDDTSMPPAVRQGMEFSSEVEDQTLRIALHRYEGTSVGEATVLRRVRLTLDGVGARAGLELEAEINPGDSGSPLIDDMGRIAGLVFASTRNRPNGWAIAVSEVVGSLDEIGQIQELTCG